MLDTQVRKLSYQEDSLDAAINQGDVAAVRSLLQGDYNYVYLQNLNSHHSSTKCSKINYVQLAVTNITTPHHCNTKLLSIGHCYALKMLFDQFRVPKELQSIIICSYFAFDITPHLQILRLLTRPTSSTTPEDAWETTSIVCYQDTQLRHNSSEIGSRLEWMAPLFQCTFPPDAMRKIIVLGYNLSDRFEGLYAYELNHLCSSVAFHKNQGWMLYLASHHNLAPCLANLPVIPEAIKNQCEATIAAASKRHNLAITSHCKTFTGILSALICSHKPILIFTAAASVASTALYFCLSDSNNGMVLSTVFEALARGLGYVDKIKNTTQTGL